MRITAWAAGLFPLLFASPVAAQSDLELCAQGTPQFPQACPCIITRSEASGITGPVLSSLLVNDTTGVPMATFQAYGAIFIQCINEAVMASVPGAPPVPQVPAPSVPAQSATTPLSTPTPETTLTGQSYGSATLDPIVFNWGGLAAPGTWDWVGVTRGGNSFSGPGVHDGRGHVLKLDCQGDGFQHPTLFLGGLGARETMADLLIEVRRGNGQVLASEARVAVPVEGVGLVTALTRRMADGIRAGSTLRVTVDGGAPLEFGLRGSNRAVGRGVCGAERFSFQSNVLGERWVPTTPWIAETRRVEARAHAIAWTAASRDRQALPLEVTCDKRLTLPRFSVDSGLWFPDRGPLPMTINLDAPWGGEVIELALTERDDTVTTTPLSDADIAKIASARLMFVTLVYFEEAGGFQTVIFPTDGFGEVVSALACPPPPEPIGAVARVDATAIAPAWTGADLGRFFDRMSPNPAYVPGAFYASNDPAVPTLGMDCSGRPFVNDPWPGPSFTVRMAVDGDPAKTRDVEWFSARSDYFPGEGFDGFDAIILGGETLRMTLVSDPSLDVLYSLKGLAQTLRAAGCE